jgi:hypothetical protein
VGESLVRYRFERKYHDLEQSSPIELSDKMAVKYPVWGKQQFKIFCIAQETLRSSGDFAMG